jgi:Carbohydrate family 9 binding domain-like
VKMKNRARIEYISDDFAVEEFENEAWSKAEDIGIDKQWSGDPAAIGRRAKAKMLWSSSALYVRFEANQAEPLVVNETPNLDTKTKELWDRDVCEIFVAPDAENSRKYFEFEIAPTGEWIDISIHQTPEGRVTDFAYHSGMKSAAKIEDVKIWMALKIDFTAFNGTPSVGDIWKGNLFRCIGKGKTRGYLAWQPTKTKKPNFHVPTAFGEFEFTK